MATEISTIHATALLIGRRAVLIRGPSGSGKSRLALALLQAAATGLLPFARLVGDDRVQVAPSHGRVLVRPAPALQGLLEIRGIGIKSFEFEPVAVAGLVVDLASPDARRLPDSDNVDIAGLPLPRLAVAAGIEPLPLVLAAWRTAIVPQPAG